MYFQGLLPLRDIYRWEVIMPAPEGAVGIGLGTASACRDASRPFTPACSSQSTLFGLQPLLPAQPGPRQPCMRLTCCSVSPGSTDRQR